MADLHDVENIFEKKYRTTLKETSKDTANNEYLCQSKEEVINFDTYMQIKAQEDNTKIKKSFDALYFNCETSHIYCVEFKKQECEEFSNKAEKIKGKFIDGLTELKNIFESKKLEISNYNFHLFVVFKVLIEQKESMRERLVKRATKYSMNAEKGNFLTNDSDFKKQIPLCQDIDKLDIRVGFIQDFMEDYKKLFNHESDC